MGGKRQKVEVKVKVNNSIEVSLLRNGQSLPYFKGDILELVSKLYNNLGLDTVIVQEVLCQQ